MSKKLAAKAGLIQLPPAAPQNGSAQKTDAGDGRPKTAPGSMLAFMSHQSASVKEAEELRARVSQFEGASPVRLMNPADIRPSKWANRHPDSFTGADFAQLKQEIADAGGNVQPIKVRHLSAAEGSGYEVVYGHRRHRACLEVGVPVRALVEEVSDQELFVEMERENRQRKDLSAWEQGQMYERALNEGLYPSQGKLAQAIGRDLGDVGKALKLARLPKAVVEAFASPLDLQFRWAKPLSDAQQADPEGLLRRAKELRKANRTMSAREVLARLLGTPETAPRAASETMIRAGGQVAGVLRSDANGRVTVSLDTLSLDAVQQQRLVDVLEKFLSER
jgi:ParB family transcriptional regulator, chromosome partitioning protein